MIYNFTYSRLFSKSIPVFIFTFLLPVFLSAQMYVDAVGMGGIYDDKANSIVMDDNKNVYMAGNYTDSVDFDPSANTANHTTVAAPNAFLAKYNSTGNYLWSVSIEGPQPIEIRDIAVGNSGHVYVTGDFMGTATFDTSTSYTASGVFDAFIAKYDISGTLIWAKAFGGPAPDWCYSLTLDTNENIITTGTFTALADFDASAANFTINTNGGSPDIFLVKYDSSGNFVWATNAGGPSMDEGHSVETDGLGNIYLTGWYLSSTANFGGNVINSNGGRDIFLAQYDNNGTNIWAHGMGSPQDDEGTAIHIQNSDLYLTGIFQGTANIDPNQTAPTLVSNGGDDIFLARFDTSGNFDWSTSMGGVTDDISNDMGMDIEGNTYLTGYFSSTADFSTGFSTIAISSQGDKDIFVAKYDSAGAVITTMGIGGTGEDISNGLAIDDEHFYIAGSFSNTVDFSPLSSSSNLVTSPAGKSIFKAKYSYCKNNYEIAYDTICSGDIYMVDSTVGFMSTGSYRVNINSTNNVCDSVLTLHLEVTSMNLNVSLNGNVLTSGESQASYQWLDCDADTLITGETSDSLTATHSGNYAVIINKNNCVDTSACINVTMVGLEEQKKDVVLEIYPNPSNGSFTISSMIDDSFKLYNLLGEIVGTGEIQSGNNRLEFELKEGIYFLTTEKSSKSFKLVLQ